MKKNTNYTIKGIKIVVLYGFIGFLMIVIYGLTNIFSTFPMVRILSYIAYIVLFISGIAMLLGIYFIFKGKKEYGPNHEKSMSIAVKLIILTIVLFYITTFLQPLRSAYPHIYTILETIRFVPYLLTLIYLIKELAEDHIKKLLWFGFLFGIVINFVTNWINNFEVSTFSEDLAIFISLIPLLFILFCYYKTYSFLRYNSGITSDTP